MTRIFWLSILQLLLVEQGFSQTLLVADKSLGELNLIDARTFSKRAVIKVGDHPHEAVTNSDGDIALVSHYGGLLFNPGNNISIIDVKKGTKIGDIPLPEGSRPHGIVFIDEQQALVTLQGLQSLALVSTQSRKIVFLIKLSGSGAHMVSLSPDKEYAFVTNNQSGTVLKVDLDQRKIVATAQVGSAAEGMVLTSNGAKLLVGNRKDHKVFALKTSDLSILWELDVSWGPIRMILFDSDRYAAVTSVVSGKVDIIDLSAPKIVSTFSPVGSFAPLSLLPVPITIIPYDSRSALVANSFEGHVSLIDLSKHKVLMTFEAGKEPDGMAMSAIDVGGVEVASALRKLEQGHCATVDNDLCYDEEGFAKHDTIATFGVIAAERKQVWNAITDLDTYGQWNPFMPWAKSTLVPGDPLKFKVDFLCSIPIYETVHIKSREEYRSICWGSEPLGLVTKRCFYLTDLEDGRTLYYSKERFKGPLAGIVTKSVGQSLKNGLDRETQALITRAQKN